MHRRTRYLLLPLTALLAAGTAGPASSAPAGRGVEGRMHSAALAAADSFPRGCVDCHINRPDLKRDTRLSTALAQWTTAVDPKLLAVAQGSAPPGLILKGKHPPAPSALLDIPAGCMACHAKTSKFAPPLSRMAHRIHLVGADNHFLTEFKGDCTHCHKLDQATGAWSLPSGREK